MKIFRIVIDSIMVVVSLISLLKLPYNLPFSAYLPFILMAYILVHLLLGVVFECLQSSFPTKLGFLIVYSFFAFQFLSEDYLIFDKLRTTTLFGWASVILATSSLLSVFFGIPLKLTLKKMRLSTFRYYYRFNAIIYFSFLAVLLSLSYFIEKGNFRYYGIRYAAILLAFIPYFNKSLFKSMVNQLMNSKVFTDLDVSFGQLGILSRIKNFVFLKDKIISSGNYQITESDYRSTIKVTTAIQLCRLLSEAWNSKYTRLFVSDEQENFTIKYQVVQKNENGITVIDDDACMYHFGNSSFMKDKIHRDDRVNLFLVRNEIPLAKFKVNEKIMPEKIELLNQLDRFGNTVLFNHGIDEDLGHDYSIVFDKIYSSVNEDKQTKLLAELEKKAPTALFSTKIPEEIPNSVCFQVTSNTDAKIENKNKKIVINPQMLNKVPIMIKLSKKIHSRLNYLLLISSIFQIALAVFAFLNYQALELIFGLNMTVAIFFELFAKRIFLKLNHLPSQPANLAQSHQAV